MPREPRAETGFVSMTEACRLDLGLIPFELARDMQKELVGRKQNDFSFPEVLLLLEHPPVFTLGRWGKLEHVLADPESLSRIPIDVVRCERGGQATYHGPGQLVGYPVLDLKKLGLGVRDCVRQLEEVIVRTLADFGVRAQTKEGFPGVWVGPEKIASLGLALQQGITFHGFALNYALDLWPFTLIHPCGLPGVRMTSLNRITGEPVEAGQLRGALGRHFEGIFKLRWTAVDDFRKFWKNGLKIAEKYRYILMEPAQR